MGNRLTLPLLLLAALLAGGAFFWMSGGERRSGAAPSGAQPPAAAPERPSAELTPAPSAPSEARPEAVRAPIAGESSPAPKPARKAGESAAAVSGQVVDRFGTPIAGARVLVAADTGFPLDLELERDFSWLRRQHTETDAEGRFRFESVEPGALRLGVHAKGFAPHDQRGLAVPPAGLELGPVTMVRGAVLSGIVVDPEGRPVGGARIVRDDLEDGAGVFMLGSREPSAVSAADGRFRVDELACGPWRFVVRSEEHPDLAVEGLAEEPGVEVGGLRWQLAPGATIAGTVTGVPAAERDALEVRATRGAIGDGFLGFGSARIARVESSGAFVVRGLTMGESYNLQARRAQPEGEFGFWERSRSNSVHARAGDSGVILAYQPEAAVTFTVVDGITRAPIERLEVEAGIEWPLQLTDDDGRPRTLFPGGVVRVGGLRPSAGAERVQINVQATGYREYERADIAVRAGQELDLGTIALDPVPVVRVRVLDRRSGKPIEGAHVRLQKRLGDVHEVRRSITLGSDEGHESIEFGEGRSALTGGDGWAVLTSYPGETVDLSARARGFAPARREAVALPREATHEEELRLSLGGTVAVQVLDAQGLALAGATVEHREPGSAPEGGVVVLGGTRGRGEITDSEGRVRFENLAPGPHSFRLGESGGGAPMFASDHVMIGGLGDGDDDSWSQVQVVEGETSELVLHAAPRARLAGRVRETGKVLPGASLRLESESQADGPSFRIPGMGGGGPEAKSDGEGRYRIEDVKAGRYTLTVTHPTRRMPSDFEVELREGENTFDVDLALAVVAGRVLDPRGQGVPGVRVWPERQSPRGRQVDMRMIMIDDSGEGGMLDSQQFGERAVTDAEGRYSLRGVASDVELLIRAEGDAVQPVRSEPVRLSPNEVKEGVDLVVEPAGSIRVEAKLADGSPARFQLVQAEYLDPADPPLQPKFGFLQQGSTALTGLKPGRWRVNVRSAQGAPDSSNPGQDQEIEVRAQEQATATFEVD